MKYKDHFVVCFIVVVVIHPTVHLLIFTFKEKKKFSGVILLRTRLVH